MCIYTCMCIYIEREMYRNNPYISALAKERCTAVSGTPKPTTQTTLCGWAGRWSEGHDVTPKPCRKKEERERGQTTTTSTIALLGRGHVASSHPSAEGAGRMGRRVLGGRRSRGDSGRRRGRRPWKGGQSLDPYYDRSWGRTEGGQNLEPLYHRRRGRECASEGAAKKEATEPRRRFTSPSSLDQDD